MKNTFRQSMTWLHTWAGLLLGWVLFAIFLTGTATYFRWEITQWMQPEAHRSAGPIAAAHSAATYLEREATLSSQWFVELPDSRVPATQALWRLPDAPRRFERATLDAATGDKIAARDTRGGEFFYRFHFQLQLPHPWGRYLAGVAAMFMFIALISGVVAHRQFFADFFTFRAGRPGLRSWLDFHNVTAVLALPFYFMITYSALVIFVNMYMPWGRQILADPPSPTARTAAAKPGAASGSNPSARTATPKAWIAPAPLAPMIQVVEQAWGTDGRTAKRMDVADRGTAKCVVTFTRNTGSKVSLGARETLRFNGVTGAALDPLPVVGGPGTAAHDVFYGLHLARFAGPGLRWLFFVMGLFGTALVATGLVMWTIKRRPQQTGPRLTFGHGLVERLNITGIAGLPIAVAVLFWANRLLPVTLTERGDWEVYCFLYAWGVTLLHPWVRPVMAAWREQLWVGAVLFLLLPALDLLTAGEHLRRAFLQRDWAHPAFDAAMLGCGWLLLTAGRRIGRRKATPVSPPATPIAHQSSMQGKTPEVVA